jgi:hypothetical protein
MQKLSPIQCTKRTTLEFRRAAANVFPLPGIEPL